MWFVVFGIVVGLLSGALGIGGGIVIVPGLVLLFGFNQLEAQGTSLAVLSLPICLAAASIYYQNGHVRPAVVALIALGFIVGAVAGAKLIAVAPIEAMRIAFGTLLLYLGMTFVLEGRVPHAAAALPAVLTSLFTAIAARIWRRGHPTSQRLSPPSPDFEYHI
jgi:uncharacterized membrane protein YfcA